MDYIESNLMNDEKVKYRAGITNFVFWPIPILLFISISLMIFLGNLLVALGFFCLAILSGIPGYIRKISTIYAITNKRVMVKYGVIKRGCLDVPLSKIEAVRLEEQSVIGRIFNFGTVTVVGTGGTNETFSMINDPLSFRQQIQEQMTY